MARVRVVRRWGWPVRYPAKVYVHDTPGGSPRFHRNGKLTPWWHDFPCREMTVAEAETEGNVPCPFCFPEDNA